MNKVMLLGRLTKEPEMKITNTELSITTFTLAVPRKYSKKGEDKKVDFINCKAFGKTAEFCNNYFEKGRQVAIEGSLQINTWDDAEGKRVYFTEVVIEQGYFADSKKEGHGNKNKSKQVDEDDGFQPVDDSDLPF